ncbi:MAG TPA: DnaA N-terminal domain-containing protein [Anaerolineales bacterium]|nr:DnaA N-terminal domain-containing protein [Anaerolineales bacterium]
MNPQQIWESVLAQLQQEMPRASYETWVRDTEALSLEQELLTISVRNVYARDWLSSRLTNRVQRILQELLQKSITVRFVAADAEEEIETDEEAPETEIAIEPVQWLDYDRIVQPHKQVVVKGYLRRLSMEIGPKAIWLYIGFHQAAWKAHALGRDASLPSRVVMRFSGLPNGTFWRLLNQPAIQRSLEGLVERMDPAGERRFRRGRDGRPHRAPIRYRVSMTPRLTRADAAAVYERLKNLVYGGASVQTAMQALLAVENVMELFRTDTGGEELSLHTVMDMARLEVRESFSPELDQLAQELQRRITNCLGDIHLTHYFIEQVIPSHHLTPAQAWLVTVARDMAFINARTGERRDIVTFQRGYREMADLVGSKRYKTIQAWLHPNWKAQQRGGDLTHFLVEVQMPESNTYPDLRVESMPRSFRVLLDEPLDANGSIRLDANGSHMADADGIISQTQMGALVDANGSHMADANGSVLNSFKHPSNTSKKNTSTTQHGEEQAAEAAPEFWELSSLLQRNDVHPKVQRELLEVQASVHAFVSWVLYVASPDSGNLSDPLGYALSRLREHPLKEARGVFRQFADLPPVELLGLIDATPTGGYQLPPSYYHPLAHTWKKTMGTSNRRLPAVRAILFGEQEES